MKKFVNITEQIDAVVVVTSTKNAPFCVSNSFRSEYEECFLTSFECYRPRAFHQPLRDISFRVVQSCILFRPVLVPLEVLSFLQRA